MEKILKILGGEKSVDKSSMQKQDLIPAQSNRLNRLVQIIAHTEEVFGSQEKAQLWLNEQNRALQMATPLSLLDTDEGVHRVEDLLIRIEHGVFS